MLTSKFATIATVVTLLAPKTPRVAIITATAIVTLLKKRQKRDTPHPEASHIVTRNRTPNVFNEITGYLTPEEQADLACTNKASPQTVIRLPRERPEKIEEYLNNICTKSDEGRWITHIRGASWMTDEDLKKIAQKFPNLTTLDLTWCKQITAAGLEALAKCPNLTTLNLANCYNITDDGLKDLATACPNLTTLNLSSCYKITDDGLKDLAKCPNLTTLDLTCHNITDAGLEALATACPKLTTLDLTWCDKITNAGITALAKARTNLTTLILTKCVKITDTGLTALQEQLPQCTIIYLAPF